MIAQAVEEDDQQTVTMDELKSAIIRFNLGLSEKQIKVFLQRLDAENTGFMTQEQFIKRFWSAYTYEDIIDSEDEEDELKKKESPTKTV